MALARLKKICMDVRDVAALGRFWSVALDQRLVPDAKGEAGLVDTDGRYPIWFNRVPQDKSVKHRVHLDIYARSLADLVAIGATVLRPQGDDRGWTVMADPAGGEFCAFLRDELPARRLHGVVIDSADPFAQARWWHRVLGGRLVEEKDYATVTDVVPDATMDFTPVTEPKTAPNRIHWDVAADTLEPLLAAGATVVRSRGGDIAWTILADPEGNEFCAFTR